MNKDIFEGSEEMRGQIKEWWGNSPTIDLEQRAHMQNKLSACSPTEVWLHPPARRRGIQPADKGSERGS